MMQLGYASAILPDLSLEDVVQFTAANGFSTVELMCWPAGKAERRYAGVTHIDVVGFTAEDAARVNELAAAAGITISGLGYYPNPLTPDQDEAQVAIDHIKRVIEASALLGIGIMNTFVGRDWTKSVDDNWPRFLEVWTPLIRFAEDHNVKIGIENCPMAFTNDDWPGGKNLAHTPAIWRRMFADIPSDNFGLNYDPSQHDLAAHGLSQAAPGLHRQALPRPRQGRAPRQTPSRRSRHHGTPRSSFTCPNCPAWAISTGASFSPSSATSATTAPSALKSRTAPTKTHSKAAKPRLSRAAAISKISCPDRTDQPNTRNLSMSLESEIRNITANSGAEMGVSALHLESGQRIDVDAERVYPLCSVLKIPVLVEAFRQIEEASSRSTTAGS